MKRVRGWCLERGVRSEWYRGFQARAGVGLTIGDDEDSHAVMFHLTTPLGSLFLTTTGLPRAWIERILPGYWIERSGAYKRFDEPGPDRLKVTQAQEIRVDWHDNALWWSLWHPVHEWHSETPRWRHGSWHPIDTLLGQYVYTSTDIGGPVEAIASFVEGDYSLTLQRERHTWKRPRWPVVKVRESVDIRVSGNAPGFRGKGENSWDIGDDAILGMSAPGRSYGAAVGAYVGAVLRNRERYGHLSSDHRAVLSNGQ